MNKETYDQTVINFHSQLLAKEFVDHGVEPDKNRLASFVNSAMNAFVSNFNDTLAHKFLSDLDKQITKDSTLDVIYNLYPENFFNYTDGRKLMDKQANANSGDFLKSCFSLGQEMTKIKTETSGIPPRLLDTAKKELMDRFDTALDKFTSSVTLYSKHDPQLGINMIKDVMATSGDKYFLETTQALLNESLSDKILNKLKEEHTKKPNEINEYLFSLLNPVKSKVMKP